MAKLISVFSPKGGVGKTTISLHLADALSQQNKKVLVYDSDTQKALTEVFQHSEELSFTVTDQSPSSIDDFDYVIVDFPPSLANLTREQRTILDRSDHVVSPIRASRLDLMSFKSIKDQIQEDRLISVLSCYDKRVKDQVQVHDEIANDFIVISYSSIYSRTINACKTIFSESVKNLYGVKKAQAELLKLVELVK